jgi:hypothetical protein
VYRRIRRQISDNPFELFNIRNILTIYFRDDISPLQTGRSSRSETNP